MLAAQHYFHAFVKPRSRCLNMLYFDYDTRVSDLIEEYVLKSLHNGARSFLVHGYSECSERYHDSDEIRNTHKGYSISHFCTPFRPPRHGTKISLY